MALHWNGSRWVRVSTPSPGTVKNARLDALTCASANNWWATGSYYYMLVPGRWLAVGYTMALHWNGSGRKLIRTSQPWYGNGSKWVLVKTPTIHNDSLYGIDCTGARRCGPSVSSAGFRLVA
jgi:hypothetical protein